MRIAIWYSFSERSGGANSFLRALALELGTMGHSVSTTPSPDADVVLANSFSQGQDRYLTPGDLFALRMTGHPSSLGRYWPLRLEWFRSRKCPAIVHRVDGVARLYGRRDPRADPYQFRISSLSDLTVFQSGFCRECFAKFGVTPTHSRIIHNAVDPGVFHPAKGDASGPIGILRLLAISWSSNRNKGFDTLSTLSQIPGTEIRFVGNWCKDVDPGKVLLLGTRSQAEIANLMRESDAFVHPASNDTCPNVVLEALSCALPVLYNTTGGTPEIVGSLGIPLESDLEECIEQMRAKWKDLRQIARERHLDFSISVAARSYLDAFSSAMRLRESRE